MASGQPRPTDVSSVAPYRSRLRAYAASAVLLLLALPAASIVPSVQWNVHLRDRLRAAHRAAPDSDHDRLYQSIGAYVPAGSPVGVVIAPLVDSVSAQRARYLLQYALAPRRVVLSADAAYVVAVGAWRDGGPLDTQRFALVKDFDDCRLYRQVAP